MSYTNVKNARERLKKRIIYVMGDKCQCCGYSKCQSALELHHVNPKKKVLQYLIIRIEAGKQWFKKLKNAH